MTKVMKSVYMDESGNRESDRFFVTGFLELDNIDHFYQNLYRIHDQILHLSRYNRLQRVNRAKSEKDLETLYQFAKNQNSFELKFDRISKENIRFFQDLVKVLVRKIDFRFTAIVIDRHHKDYLHHGLVPMYKIIMNTFKHCLKEDAVFVPDMFDTKFNWTSLNLPTQIKTVIPNTSDSCFPLQVVDVLTGIVALGLRTNVVNRDLAELTNSDQKRTPLLNTLEAEIGKKITSNFTANKPKYFSVWTIDFSKSNRNGSSKHGQETQL